MVGVDLEADSMHHFNEKVCLLQLASPSLCAVVDPLKIEDLSLLKPLFGDPAVRKIFHGADYDIRSLYRDFGIEINNLLDTELASRFLGCTESGLDAVLSGRFGIKLTKAYQKKDWSRRPLPEEMMCYAAMDVLYLIPLAREIEKDLAEKNRLQWVEEECRLLSRVRPPAASAGPLFVHFKGAGRLDRRSLAVLEALLSFRRKEAARKDRPLFKVFRNEQLKEIALAKPVTVAHLAALKVLGKKQRQMYGERLVAVVKKAMKIPDAELPVYPRKRQANIRHAAAMRVKKLKQWRNKKGEALQMDPALILNRHVIREIAVKNITAEKCLAGIEGLRKWQYEAFGREIITELAGGK